MDSERLGFLIDRFASVLELFARQWCDTPEDVVQDAFVQLAAQRVAPAHPESWLFRTVRNGAINAGIATRRRRRHEQKAATAEVAWFQMPSASTEGVLDSESAQSALAELPVGQREIIVGHIWGGLTFEQLAEITGTSASSAHRAFQAGLQTLRERLGVPCRANTSRRTPI